MLASDNDPKTTGISATESDARSKIGRHLVYWALSAVTILGLAGMYTASNAQTLAGVKDILSIILPVIAAWVGTVLAFYFSRENYVAAAENNAAILGLSMDQKLNTISASDVMIRIDGDGADVFKTDSAEKDIKLKTELLDQQFLKYNRNRLPILDTKGLVRYVIHRSIIDKFISTKALAGGFTQNETLEDLTKDDDNKSWITAHGSVSSNAKLGEVKSKMDSDPKCADIFVTEDGTPRTRAIGWVTNIALLEKLKA